MARNRVLSFMSHFSNRDSRSPTPTSSPSPNLGQNNRRSLPAQQKPDPYGSFHPQRNQSNHDLPAPSTPAPSSPARADGDYGPSPAPLGDSPSGSPAGRNRSSSSRPLSMVQAYQPPLMDVNEDTIPELQPIFTLLNSHANKLYQEGYFLKLDDQNTHGRPNPDRTWTECFAQLVGTVLSLWDAAELDAAGEDGEVLPKFINLTDASIKMIESLPTRSNSEEELRNILSISTAGRNRYLLHFNSHHSLIQWTAGIRLAMFEHSTLQEAYTGALIAGKGKTVNNINLIMDKARFKTEEWVRVRFGAGVPWRRCWCVITPPDEKEYLKLQKEMKKRSPYDRSHLPVLKGDIKFYDTRKEGKKQKKAVPIASITDAFSAYAIYPQAKSLIDMSTLVKIEGNITIHSDPPSSTEGFVFIMPEVHPAVTGFEMLLRFLFPTWDTFGLYGRPGRLVASVLDPRSLMFAMPKHKRYGYLEILDVTGLILTEGSSAWQEREWRKRLKELTGRRMNAMEDGSQTHGRSSSRNSKRLSFGVQQPSNQRPRVNFADDTNSVRSSRSMSITQQGPRTDSAPPVDRRGPPTLAVMDGPPGHMRNVSDTQLVSGPGYDGAPGPHMMMAQPPMQGGNQGRNLRSDLAPTPERVSSEDERPYKPGPVRDLENMARMQTPEPVSLPPAFAHTPYSKPTTRPYHSPEMRRQNSRLSSTTLSQLAKAGGLSFENHPEEGSSGRASYDGSARSSSGQGQTDLRGQAAVETYANPVGMRTSADGSREALNNTTPPRSAPGLPPPQMGLPAQRSRSPLGRSYGPPDEYGGPQQPMHASPPPMGPPPQPNAGSRIPPDTRNFNTAYDQRMGPPPPPAGSPNAYQQYQPRRSSLRQQSGGSPDRQPQTIQTSGSINRKPLPQRTTSLQRQGEDGPPRSPSSTGSFSRALDESALAQVQPPEGGGPRPDPDAHIVRQDTQKSGYSSNYDDAASTTSPDYASTRKSTDTQESVEKPRAGVLKTVGDASTPQGDGVASSSSDYAVPEISFGPTYNYASPPVPRNKTPTPLSGPGGSGGPSPGRNTPTSTAHIGSAHTRQDSEDTIRRSVAWQPGGATVGSPSVAGGAISPEQFVQQRAAAATNPLYTHQRQPSGNTPAGSARAGTPTPPLKRSGSQDYLTAGGGHSRSSSADLLQQGRPASQTGYRSGGGTGDVSSHLSAREQEHVARVTGSPLINVGGGNNNRAPAAAGGGLVGAIEAREREKAQIKQGYGGSQVVQQAINQRQALQAQQAAQLAFAQQQQQQTFQQGGYPGRQIYGGAPQMGLMPMAPMGTPSPPVYASPPMGSPMGSPGPAPAFSPGPGQGPPGQQQRPNQMMQQQQQQSYGPPPGWLPASGQAAQVYAQGGGWRGPMAYRQGPPPPGQQQQPGPQQGFSPPPHGQYSPGQGPQQGAGRGGMPYQGQAF